MCSCRLRGTLMEPAEELAKLRQFLWKLQSGEMTIRMNTKREIDKLKRDIKYLEKVLAGSAQTKAHTHVPAREPTSQVGLDPLLRADWQRAHATHKTPQVT
jgi:hypothetical protein